MINRVVLVGRLTNDIEVRKTSSALSVASFTIACNRRVAQGQERQADFINCVAWRQTADFLGRYARKGSLVGVEGRIQTRNYEGQDGKRVYVTEIVCDSAQLLESKQVTESRPAASTSSSMSYGAPAYDNQPSDVYDLGSGPILDISSDDLPF
ncbi:MAG: single-stranded DNA-binding protein [Erysipelotrichaceae bacterium]